MQKIEIKTGIPIYLQIEHALIVEIATRKIQPGGRMPSLNELHELHGCDRNTAVKIYARLKRDGFIDSQPSRGYTVAVGAVDKARSVLAGSISRRLREIRHECRRTGLEMKE